MLIKSTLTIEAAMKKNQPKKLFDGDGLILDIRSATSASWVFKFTWGKTPDEVGLGSLKKVDLAAARKLRAECLQMLGASPQINPRLARRAAKLEIERQANAPRQACISELIKANVRLIAKKAKSQRQQQAWIDSLQEARIGKIAKLLPEEVTEADVLALLEPFYKRAPVMADDIRQRLSRLLVWAVKTPGWTNPCRWEGFLEDRVKRQDPDEETAHPSLDHMQVGALVKSLRGENERIMNAMVLEWLILSASRADEACEADWSEIDWASDCWVIPASRMKMRREHAVPLTDRHHEILARLKPMDSVEFPASGPIFPGRDPSRGISVTGLRKYMQSLRDADGQPYVDRLMEDRAITLHGFRSTFRTWAEEQMAPDGSDYRYSEKLLETCLAHAVGSTTRRKYVRSAQVEARRQIMETWAKYCGVVQAAKVVPMRQRRAA